VSNNLVDLRRRSATKHDKSLNKSPDFYFEIYKDWSDSGRYRMNVSRRSIGLLNLGVIFLTLSIIAAMISAPLFAASQTFTGIVGDGMCGAKHVMPGDDASCTRKCVSKGSKYALLLGDKVYVLEVADKPVLETLDKWAGQKATITGAEKGGMITVTSVRAAQ
jgi:hypothetical protein